MADVDEPQSREDYNFERNWKKIKDSPKTLFLSFLVVIVVYGMLYMMNTYWMWALLLAVFAGWLFWYMCEKCEAW
jgi:xanthine/uracil permease